MDDDDRWLPEKLAKQVARFQQDPALGFLYSKTLVEQGGQIVGARPSQLPLNTFGELFRINFIPYLTVMVRKCHMDDVGGFDTTLPISLDYELWLRLAQRCSFDWIPEPLAVYRLHAANISKNRVAYYHDHFRLFQAIPVNPHLGVTAAAKRKRVAEERVALGRHYRQQGVPAQAVGQYLQGLLAYPLAGLRFWDPETERFRFSAPYRALKPYVELASCAALSIMKGTSS